ncbi:MAG: hypothetical protein AAGB48_07830 [Planctomycetota bacterium]
MADTRLQVNLASWIIQDGNYDDFACGQQRDFSIEFWHDDTLTPLGQESPKSVVLTADSLLQVTAEVVVCTDTWYAIDFGVTAFREQRPTDAIRLGQTVSGSIALGIDPFFYMEYLHRDAAAVPMIYSWRIDRIQMQTAPFIESTQKGIGKVLVRDPAQIGWKDIRATEAWTDDDGSAEYLLDILL